jgi:hypothetical protein
MIHPSAVEKALALIRQAVVLQGLEAAVATQMAPVQAELALAPVKDVATSAKE